MCFTSSKTVIAMNHKALYDWHLITSETWCPSHSSSLHSGHTGLLGILEQDRHTAVLVPSLEWSLSAKPLNHLLQVFPNAPPQCGFSWPLCYHPDLPTLDFPISPTLFYFSQYQNHLLTFYRMHYLLNLLFITGLFSLPSLTPSCWLWIPKYVGIFVGFSWCILSPSITSGLQ